MSWRVQRVSGVLVPGFSKRFPGGAPHGTTRWCGVPIGRFAIVPVRDGRIELRYLRWPVVDVLERAPADEQGDIPAAGYLRLPGGARARFCRFRLVPPAPD